jgi:hypothetical protein
VTARETHESYAELAAGYALRALEPADEATFRSHLADCVECQQSLAAHTETLGHLAYAAAPAALPAGILEGIRREIGRSEPAASAPAPVSLDAARARRRPRFDSRSWVGIAAAVALVLSLGVWNMSLQHDKTQGELRADRLAAAVSALEVGSKHHVRLTDPSGQAVAIAVIGLDDRVSLVVDGLRANDRRTSTYVLWEQGPYGDMRPVGAFDVLGHGVDVVRNLPLAGNALGVKAFAVTQEPGRHAPPRPGSKPVASGGVTA